MAILPNSAEYLARLGANIEISSDARYLPASVESIIRIAVGTGAHVTVHADNYLPDTLENFVRIGKGKVTIKI